MLVTPESATFTTFDFVSAPTVDDASRVSDVAIFEFAVIDFVK